MNYRSVLSLLGPNGCGKGTTCKYLKAMGAHVETTSAVIEDYKNENRQVAETIHHYKTVLKQNVPSQIVIDAMIDRMRPVFKQKHTGLFALDGMGRKGDQIIQFAEWIENRNVDYEYHGLPKIKHGHVFYTLSFEETMRRVKQRVEETLAKGEEPRAEDLGDEPEKRFNVYFEEQEILILTARKVSGLVTIIDLGKHTTMEAAGHILGFVHETDPEHFVVQLREKFPEAA
jgi:adenylate kinase family enzyme